jgi:signal transduction histidine kinase
MAWPGARGTGRRNSQIKGASMGRGLPRRLYWPPILFLCLGLLVTSGATVAVAEIARSRAQTRFAANVTAARVTIQERLQAHISLLYGVAGLFAASDAVSHAEFHRFVDRLDLREAYPGVQGLGFSARVRLEDLAAVEAQAREAGLLDFRIWPEGAREEYHAILYLEPLDARNQAAIGFDMYTEALRREAMSRARDSGAEAATGALILVQEIDDNSRQAGFLIYVPVYEGGIVPPTVEGRRERLLGFAYSPFRAGDLFRGILGEERGLRVGVAIYDGAAVVPEALLHQTIGPAEGYRPAFSITETITVAGRPWTIHYSSLPGFDASGERSLAPLTAAAGLLLTLILFVVALAQSRARHEAERAVLARDTFLSVASHELKTPLTSLYGNAQLLQRRLARGAQVGERERDNVNAIVAQTRRLAKLIDDLLDHTRIREGRLEIQRVPLDLAEIVKGVAAELGPTLVRHTLSLDLPPAPLPILGDATRVEQMLVNLIGNAVKYSPQGGAVEVSAERAEPWALVRVRDHGIGIPAAAQAQLFGQFYRAPNAVSKHISGMGIGLYIVKELVERHGGTIAVESKEGEGSSFTLLLPIAESPAQLSSPQHRSDPPVSLRP